MKKSELVLAKDKIIAATVLHVPFEGWRKEILAAGARDAGFDAAIVRSLFPSGIVDALDHFADMADRKMLQHLEKIDAQNLRVREKISSAVMARYEFLNVHKDAFRQYLQFWMFPTRKPRGAKILWRSADRIWVWAGDTARDYNRYTKRSLLCAVMASSALALINDPHDDLDNTKAFVDRRIENVMQLGKITGKFSRRV